jgi:hypothetical protein
VDREASWAASGRGTVIVAGRSTRSLGINQMAAGFKRDVLGNIESHRTEVEISKGGEFLAIVYESEAGWRTEYLGPAATNAEIPGLAEQIARARTVLSHYVNRRGLNPPAGLTPQGIAFWLMEKDDGTSMGRRIDA